MPKAIIIPLIVVYVLALLPLIFGVCVFVICFDGHYYWYVAGVMFLAVCALGLALPIGLQHGNELALLAVSLICYVVSIGAGSAIYMGELNWMGWAISIMMLALSQLMVGMLFLRQSREWFRAKKELSIRNRGQTRCLVPHFLTEASHRTVRFVFQMVFVLGSDRCFDFLLYYISRIIQSVIKGVFEDLGWRSGSGGLMVMSDTIRAYGNARTV